MKNWLRRLKPRHPWALGLAALLVIGLLGSLYGYLTSVSLQLQMQGWLIAYLEKAVGGPVHLGAFRIDPLQGRIVLDNLSLASGDFPKQPFLELRQAIVGFSLRLPFAEHQVILRSVQLEEPLLNLHLLGRLGPRTPNPESKARANFVEQIFRTSIGRIEIHRGRLVHDSGSLPLELELRDFETSLDLDHQGLHYDGRLTFRESSVGIGGWHARNVSLQTNFGFYSQGLDIRSTTIRFGSTELVLQGLLANYYHPDLRLRFTARSSAEEMQASFGTELGIRGPIAAEGLFTLDGRLWKVEGSLASAGLAYGLFAPENVTGKVRLAATGAEFEQLTFNLFAGRSVGRLRLNWQDAFSGHGEFSVQDVDVGKGLSHFFDLKLPLRTTMEGTARLEWAAGRADSFRLLSKGQLQGAAPAESGLLSPSGSFALRFENGLFRFDEALLTEGQTSLAVQGTLGLDRHADLELRYRSDKAAETVRQLLLLRGQPVVDPPPWTKWLDQGEVHFQGRFAGIGASTPLSGSLKMLGPSFLGSRWDFLHTQVDLSPLFLRCSDLQLTAGSATVHGQLAVTLGASPSGPEPGFLEFEGRASRVPLALLQPMVGRSESLEGMVGGSFQVRGQADALKASARISMEEVSIRGYALGKVESALTWQEGRLLVPEITATLEDASIRGTASYDAGTGELQATLKGSHLPLSLLAQSINAFSGIRGTVDFQLQARGTLDSPEMEIQFAVSDSAWRALAPGQLRGSLSLSGRRLAWEASALVLGGRAALSGESSDWQNAGNFRAQLRFDGVEPLSITQPAELEAFKELSVRLTGSMVMSGIMNRPSEWSIDADVSQAVIRLGKLDFQSQGSFRPILRAGRIRLEPVAFRAGQNSFTLSGDILLEPEPRLDLRLNSSFDLALMNSWLTGTQAGGMATIAIGLQGAPADPELFGTCRIANGSLSSANFNYSLTGMQGIIYFNQNLARIINLQGKLSTGGSVVFDGAITLDKLSLQSFLVKATLKEVLLRIPQGFRTLSNAELVLRGDGTSQVLLGEVQIEEASYSRPVDFPTLLATSQVSRPAVAAAPFSTLSLDITLVFKNGLSISTEDVKVAADGRLRLIGPATDPSLLGRISIESGEIKFLGNIYEVTKGGIEFVNPLRIEPHFDLAAETIIKGYQINLLLRGEPDRIQPDLRSEPPLPLLDLFSLLSTGVTSEELMGTPSSGKSQPGLAASNLLASGLTQQFESRVQRVLGFRQFRIDPLLSSSSNNPTARVTLERRVSNNLSVTYSTDITTTKSQVVLIEYFFSPKYSLIASLDEDGKFGLDLRIQRKF